MSSKSRHLRLHIWQEIVYFLLVAIAPAIVTSIEVFQSHSTVFKITFSSLGCLLLLVIILRRFIFRDYVDKLRDESARLEHDYSIHVGDETLCKRQWCICNMVQYVYHIVVLIISIVIAYFLMTAISQQIIQFRGASLLILLFVLGAILFKFICYIVMYQSTMKEVKHEE